MREEFQVTDPLPAATASLSQMAELIQAIGSQAFIPAALEFAHALTGADFLSLFCQGDRDTPLLMGTASTLGQSRADRAAKGYDRHLAQDRNAALLSGAAGAGDFFTHHEAGDLDSFPYRRDCYDLPGISSRVSLVRRRSGYGLAVSLYTSVEHGPYPITARDGLIACMHALMAATERHVAFTLKGSVWQGEDVQARLALSYPGLTQREREVAAMTIKGRTAAEIAEVLGLGETTVITHRQNAYRRIGVKSMRELIAKV